MTTRQTSWRFWLAAVPLSVALIGCGGGDKPKAGGGSKPASTGGGKTDADSVESKPAGSTDAQPVAATGWGTIKGTVKYDGVVPEPKLVHKAGDQNAKDPAVCAKNDMYDEAWLVNKDNKGIQWVLVYVAGTPDVHDDLKQVTGEVEFGQEYCQFKPHLLAYRAGQKLKITSSDPVGHNTNMAPWKGDSINPLLPAAPEGGKTEMEGPDWKAQSRPFPVKCNVHGWMSAYVMILDHPYFAVTDEDGNFEIKNVPAGKIKVVSWHESGYGDGGRDGKEIDVKADDVTELNLTLKAK